MRNTHIIGKPGTGKTVTLNREAIHDIYDGKSIAYFGREADFILSHIPRKHRARTIVLDPSDTDFPFGFNPIVDADSSVETVKNLYGVGIAAPNLSLYLSASIRAIPEQTIPNIGRMLLDADYRKSLTIKNADLARFWDWYENLTERERAQKVDSTLNKIYAFLTDDTVRNIIGQKTSLDLSDLSDKIIVVPMRRRPLSKEKLGQIASLIISAMHHAGYSGTFYLDDCHRIAPMVLYNLLDDRASLVAAHQYLAQLGKPGEEPREAMLALMTKTIAFRLSAPDAKELREQFTQLHDSEITGDHDKLELLAPRRAHILTADGIDPQRYMQETKKPPIAGSLEWIIQNSRERYAAPKSVVEARLNA